MPAQETRERYLGTVALNNLGVSLLAKGSFKQATTIFKESVTLLHDISDHETMNANKANKTFPSGDQGEDNKSMADWIQSKIRMARAMLELEASGQIGDLCEMQTITLNLSTMELLPGNASTVNGSSGRHGSQSGPLPTNISPVAPIRLEIDDFDTVLPNEATLRGVAAALFHNIGVGAWCLARSFTGSSSSRTKAELSDDGLRHGQHHDRVWRHARRFFLLSLSVLDSFEGDREIICRMKLQVLVLRPIIGLSLVLKEVDTAEQANSRMKLLAGILLRHEVQYHNVDVIGVFGAGAA